MLNAVKVNHNSILAQTHNQLWNRITGSLFARVSDLIYYPLRGGVSRNTDHLVNSLLEEINVIPN